MLIDKERTVERRWELVMETAINKAVEKERKSWKEGAITALLQGPSMSVEEIAAVMRVEIEEVLRIKRSLAIT
jgi:hypothetical protein